MPVQLARDQFLPNNVAHLVQSAQPDRTAITERAVSYLALARQVSSGHLTRVLATTSKGRHQPSDRGPGSHPNTATLLGNVAATYLSLTLPGILVSAA